MAAQKVTTFLWYPANQAEEAARFYVSLFPGAKVLSVNPMVTMFELGGQQFGALNGNDATRPFTEAASLMVDCADQAEVDRLWDALLAGGGTPSMCGWLKDRFGVSWQLVPSQLPKLMGGADPAASQRAMQAMLKMQKLDVAALQRAYEGK